MANKYFRIVLFFAAFFIVGDIMAQVPPPKPGDLPIDGGIAGLLVLGIGYAIKKIHDNSKS